MRKRLIGSGKNVQAKKITDSVHAHSESNCSTNCWFLNGDIKALKLRFSVGAYNFEENRILACKPIC